MYSPFLVGKELHHKTLMPFPTLSLLIGLSVNDSLACMQDESLVIRIRAADVETGSDDESHYRKPSQVEQSCASKLPCDEILAMAKTRSSRWLLPMSGM